MICSIFFLKLHIKPLWIHKSRNLLLFRFFIRFFFSFFHRRCCGSRRHCGQLREWKRPGSTESSMSGTGSGWGTVGAGDGKLEKLQAFYGEGMISYFLQLCLIWYIYIYICFFRIIIIIKLRTCGWFDFRKLSCCILSCLSLAILSW